MLERKVVAVDGMGGDNAPVAVFEGLALNRFDNCHFIIYGDRNVMEPHAKKLPSWVSYELRHADLCVTSEMDISALRSAKNSGMGLAISAVKDKEADAVVSSGNTGLYFALAKILVRAMEGIERPALATVLPGKKSNSVCLDLGANAECSVRNLLDFAVLGEALARCCFHKEDVSLALLNIGSEAYKGNTLVKETSKILLEAFPNYFGFVEGNDICAGTVDVVVTDGFTGNVALKAIEGTAKFIGSELKQALKSNLLSMLGACLSKSALCKLKNKMDPRLHNGAIFAGLNGVVVKSHGNSDAVGFHNAVKFTVNALEQKMNQRVKEQLEKIGHHYDSIIGNVR